MENKLNVCVINDSFPPLIDGVSNTVVNYAKIINDDLGYCCVATPYYPNSDDSKFDFDVVRLPSVDTSFLVGYRAGIAFSAETISTLKDKNLDIIHSHCPITSSMLGRILREEIDKPLVFTYHTKYDIDIHNSVRGRLIQEGAIKALVDNISASDEVWVVSDGAGKNLQSIGYEGDYIIMPNGVDFEKGRADDDAIFDETHTYDLGKDIPVYLFVGRIMWYKGIKIILDALKALKEAGKDFRMVFIGSGTDKDDIVDYTSYLGLDDKVIFVNPILNRERLKSWYCRADLFLFPSTFDTNGLVVREAAACELPSVLVKGSCAAEDTADFVNAFWIDENSKSLYALLDHLGDNFDKMRVVGKQAQNDLYISWEDSVKNAYERYGVVLDNYKAGRYKSHEKLSDQFYEKSANAISDIMALQNRKNEMLFKARAEIDEQIAKINDFKTDIVGKNKQIIESGMQLDLQARERIRKTIREFEEINQKTIDFISKQFDRYK